MKKTISTCVLFIFAAALFLPIIGCKQEEHYVFPPSLFLEGERYKCTGGYMESSVDSPEYIGIIQSEIPEWQLPSQEFEVNFSGFLGNAVYRINDETVIVAYTGPAYGDWRKFELIS